MSDLVDIDKLKLELVELLSEKERRNKFNLLKSFYRDKGPRRRELYPKHIDFMNATKFCSQIGFIAANRVGKTLTAMILAAYTATGDYPEWYEGRKFKGNIAIAVASVTSIVTRDVLQKYLLGPPGQWGSGLIPKDRIIPGTVKTMGSVPFAVEYMQVQRNDGGICEIYFKSYKQGYEAWQGTKYNLVVMDEEPLPGQANVYSEALTRLSEQKGNTGMLIATFTPLKGYSDIVLSFMPDGTLPKGGIPHTDILTGGVHPDNPRKFVTCVGWDDVPHIDEQWKIDNLSSYRPHEKLARTKGIPTQGTGVIFPVAEDDIKVKPFDIPPDWPRAFGLDFGWLHPTAAVWAAQDPNSKIIYLYSEHYVSHQTPPTHAAAIKARGSWIPGICDPCCGGSQANTGVTLLTDYLELDLNITPAQGRGPYTKEPRISRVLALLESGQLKVFSHLANWFNEYRLYRRDEDGKIIKTKDDLMDATQYLIYEFEQHAITENDLLPQQSLEDYYDDDDCSAITGY